MLPSDLEARGASSAVLGKLADPDSLSDHIPITLVLGTKRRGAQKRGVPSWTASHPSFPQCLRDMNI
eukprot:5015044-Heterocapsa_arctica.AAC.1